MEDPLVKCFVEKAYYHKNIHVVKENLSGPVSVNTDVFINCVEACHNQQNAQRRLRSPQADVLSACRMFGCLFPKSAHQRLGRCAGWSETSLGALVILLVLSHSSIIVRTPHSWRQKPPKNVDTDQTSFCYVSCLMTKPTKWLCTQRRLRSAWASAQSDQSSLCA